MKGTVERVVRWAVLSGVFALPLVPFIVSYTLFFPYITGKNFTFRIIVDLVTGLWLALALVDPKYRPQRSWLLGAFTVFVIIIGIADIFGAMPLKSIWSNFERMEGWVTLAHLLAYLFVAATVLNTEGLWRRLWEWSLATSIFLSVLGFLQLIGWIPLDLGGASGLSGRIDSTFGNPIYLGVFMLFQVFIAALVWVQSGNEEWGMAERLLFPVGPLAGLLVMVVYAAGQLGGGVVAGMFTLFILFTILAEVLMLASKKYLLGFIIIVDTAALFFTGTRGAMLGLVGGALLALLLYSFSKGVSKEFRYLTVGVFVFLALIGGGLKLAKDTPFVKSVGFLDRLASISVNDSTTYARFLNMGIAWQGVKERPILGWGQENYALVFDKYYDPRMYAQEQWFDRVHDSIFDWWIAGGTLGLLAYLSIFAAAILTLWRSVRFTSAERSVLTGLIAGDFAQNLTVFDNITSWILLITVFAYIVYRESSGGKLRPLFTSTLLPQNALPYAGVVLFLAALGATWMINEPAYAANKALITALVPPQSLSDLQNNLALFDKSISYDTFGMQEAREQLAERATQVVASANVPGDLKQQFVNDAVKQLDEQSQLSPLDARFPLFAGGVLDAAGDYQEAATYLEKAHELSPRKQTILFELGQNALVRGDTEGATNYFKQAYELEPTFSTAKDNYSAILAKTGNMSELIQVSKTYVEQNPTDKQGYYTLAAAYYQSGDKSDAITTLQQLSSKFPEDKAQVDQLIAQVQSGTVKLQ